jgi:hypothetical protein
VEKGVNEMNGVMFERSETIRMSTRECVSEGVRSVKTELTFQVKGASLLYMIPLERWNAGT